MHSSRLLSLRIDPGNLSQAWKDVVHDQFDRNGKSELFVNAVMVPMQAERTELPEILVDADGCPVKQEIFRVGKRHGLKVTLVANSRMTVPREDWIELVVVDDRFDAADDWIVDHIRANDIAVTWDIPLAARCLEKGARALNPKGRVFTENSIGDALASREIQSHLRELGAMTGGPAPFQKRDRSRFLHSLDEIINKLRRR